MAAQVIPAPGEDEAEEDRGTARIIIAARMAAVAAATAGHGIPYWFPGRLVRKRLRRASRDGSGWACLQ
ncbi:MULTISPECIES: hypothetical protein [Methylobacterium]|uniref:hypothetical protein n=1 Tax=Methylobacterium TaxID=407 RepID=UPI0013ECBA01|nr:hypothetical protein [Methylobacterium sp. DB0501]NGM34766.1 hypothetical protein [Methylobacterium sp. DB0501]